MNKTHDEVAALSSHPGNKCDKPTPIDLFVDTVRDSLQSSINVAIDKIGLMDITRSNNARIKVSIANSFYPKSNNM